MLEKLKNIKKIGLFITILSFISSIVLLRDVNNLDEIWNFNFARCFANGLVAYKDFNIIQGPLVPMVCSVFLKIFWQEMLVTRILAIILDTIILFMVYLIMEKLEIKALLRYILLIILAIIMRPYFTLDYNWTILLFVLIILNSEIKHSDLVLDIKHDLLIGLLAGICVTIKQTMGLLIVVAIIGYKILEVRNLDDFKEFIKIAVIRFLGAAIPIVIVSMYLILNNALKDYIDYAILGISTFSNKISYVDRLLKNKNILIRILSILPIVNILSICFYFKSKEKNFLILSVLSIVNMIMVYPISDESHFVIAVVPTLISFIYFINISVEKIKYKDELITSSFQKRVVKTFSVMYLFATAFMMCAIVVASTMSVVYFIINISQKNLNMELNHFKYLPMSEDSIDAIKKIDNFILAQDENVYILDATAGLYMIPIDKYNKNYDMFLKGNLGSEGEEGQIQELKEKTNEKILIMNKNYNRNWQNPEEVRKYIIKNMKKQGQIGIFDIYEN